MKSGNKKTSRAGFGFALKKIILAAMIFQIGVCSPLPFSQFGTAYATKTNDEMANVCSEINARQSANKDPNVPVAGFTDCQVADQARRAKQQATIKAVVFGALAIACSILAAGEWLGSGGVCTVISIGAAALGKIYDTSLKTKIQDETNATSQGIRDGVSGAVAAFQAFKGITAGAQLFKDFGKNLKDVFTSCPKDGAASGARSSCILSASFLFIDMGLAIWEAADAKKIQKIKTEAAKNNASAAASSSAITMGFSNQMGTQENAAAVNANSESPSNSPQDPCQSAQGNAYLTCSFQGTNAAPAIAALIGDNRINELIKQTTGGKTLGDLAKGFKDEPSGSSLGNYIAGAFGLPGGLGAALGKNLEKIEGLVGSSRGELPGASYASKGSSSKESSKPAELDFSKMMEGLLKQMNPEEKTAGGPQNASEAIFRKLDLLPPEKIEANRDISLFVRIGYRYSKKAPTILSREVQGRPVGQ